MKNDATRIGSKAFGLHLVAREFIAAERFDLREKLANHVDLNFKVW